MIPAQEVAPRLLRSLGLAAELDPQGEEGEYFPQVSDAAGALIEKLEKEKRPDKALAGAAGTFEVVETILVKGDADARILVVVGFLEDLVDWAGHDVQAHQELEKHLGQKSREAWEHLKALWQSRKSLLDLMKPGDFFSENPKEKEFEDWLERFTKT